MNIALAKDGNGGGKNREKRKAGGHQRPSRQEGQQITEQS